MKRFLLQLFLFLFIFSIIIFVIGRDYNHSRNDYLEAIIDKHARLEKVDTPRLIFCGGSSLALGLDSKKIQDSTGMSVVNLGLHGGLSLEFVIKEIEANAKSSDQIIICPEFFASVTGDYSVENYVAKRFPPAANYYQISFLNKIKTFFNDELKANIDNNFIYWFNRKASVQDTSIVFHRNGFNEYGDMVLHLEKLPPHEMYDKEVMKYRRWPGIDLLNELADFANKKNIKVYFMYPTYPISEYTKNEKVISQYVQDLKKELKIPILSDPQYFVFDDSLFWDTVYHLNKKGREKRTELIIALLKRNNIISIR